MNRTYSDCRTYGSYNRYITAAFVILVLVGAGCNHTERDNVTPPVTPPEARLTPAAPEVPAGAAPSVSATPAAPEWMAYGATHRVADITGSPKTFIGKTVTVVAKVDDIYDPRAFTLSGEDENSSSVKGAGKDLL